MLLDNSYSDFEELFVQTAITGQVVYRQQEQAKLFGVKPGIFPKFTQSLQLAKDAASLTIVVRDHPTGRVGTLTIPIGK